MSRMFRHFLLIAAIVAAATFVVGAEKELPASCKRCNMRIDAAQKRFSVTVAEGIEASVFDDIGCALLWRDGECAMRTSAFDSNARVYDFETGEAIVIEQAFFVHGGGLKTPMGYDIAAFKKREDAERLAGKNKQAILTFSQLCSLKLK